MLNSCWASSISASLSPCSTLHSPALDSSIRRTKTDNGKWKAGLPSFRSIYLPTYVQHVCVYIRAYTYLVRLNARRYLHNELSAVPRRATFISCTMYARTYVLLTFKRNISVVEEASETSYIDWIIIDRDFELAANRAVAKGKRISLGRRVERTERKSYRGQ